MKLEKLVEEEQFPEAAVVKALIDELEAKKVLLASPPKKPETITSTPLAVVVAAPVVPQTEPTIMTVVEEPVSIFWFEWFLLLSSLGFC